MTARVLFYADPHPIRNGFFEFNEAAHRMHAMASEAAFAEIDWRLFSNQYILGDVATKGDAARLIWPTTEESECISSFLQEWNQEAIAARTDLVRGEGPAADFYRAVLGRIKDEFDFTHVVLWSENGAVRRFAAGAGVGVIHAELGPIRSPFKKTIYFDPFGTNANACLAGGHPGGSFWRPFPSSRDMARRLPDGADDVTLRAGTLPVAPSRRIAGSLERRLRGGRDAVGRRSEYRAPFTLRLPAWLSRNGPASTRGSRVPGAGQGASCRLVAPLQPDPGMLRTSLRGNAGTAGHDPAAKNAGG